MFSFPKTVRQWHWCLAQHSLKNSFYNVKFKHLTPKSIPKDISGALALDKKYNAKLPVAGVKLRYNCANVPAETLLFSLEAIIWYFQMKFVKSPLFPHIKTWENATHIITGQLWLYSMSRVHVCKSAASKRFHLNMEQKWSLNISFCLSFRSKAIKIQWIYSPANKTDILYHCY